MFNILSHQVNANENDLRYHLISVRMAKIKNTDENIPMHLEKMQSKGNTPPLLEGMQTSTTTLEISIAVSQKIGNQLTTRPSNTTLCHISKRSTTILQGHLFNYVYKSIFCNSQNLEKNVDTPQLKNGQRKYATFTH